jgi:MFS transporter, SP family, sugar:H+ symporter
MQGNNASSEAPVPMKGLQRFTRAFNGRLLYCCGLIALSQVNFGMDQAAFNNTQAMSAFNRQFGHYDPARDTYVIETYFLSFLNSFTYIGFMFGLVTGSTISNRFGRRIAMVIMALWALVAASVLVTSKIREQMLVGRVLAYVYIGMELALVPVLQSELVPAQVRGFVVGTYQTGLIVCPDLVCGPKYVY